MTNHLKAGLTALLLGLSAPALAQTPDLLGGGPVMKGMHGAFRNMSPEGRTILWEAMKSAREEGSRSEIRAARDRVLSLLEAERLETAALQQAMTAERQLAQAQHQRMQSAMLAAFQRLSLEDRRAFVESARNARERMADRRERMRERRAERGRQQP